MFRLFKTKSSPFKLFISTLTLLSAMVLVLSVNDTFDFGPSVSVIKANSQTSFYAFISESNNEDGDGGQTQNNFNNGMLVRTLQVVPQIENPATLSNRENPIGRTGRLFIALRQLVI